MKKINNSYCLILRLFIEKFIHRVVPVIAAIGFSGFSIASASADFPIAVGTGTDTYTAILDPPIASYTIDQIYRIKFINANTTQFNFGPEASIDLNGLGAKTIKKMDYTGKSRLLTNDITPGHEALLWYDGVDMILINPSVPALMAKTRTDGKYIGLIYGGTDWYGDWDPVLYLSSNASNGNTRIDTSKPSITLALEGGYRQSPGGPTLQEWNLDTIRADGTPERWYGFANYDSNNTGEHGWWYRAPGTLSFRKYRKGDTYWDEVGTFYEHGFKIANNYRLAIGNGDDYFFRYDNANFFLATQYGTGVVFSVASANPTLKLGMGMARKFKEVASSYQALDVDDVILVNTNAGVVTINLPYPWPVAGKELTIKDNDGNAALNNILIDAGVDRAIDGARTKLINTNWGSVKILWNDSRAEWRVIP